MSEFEDSARRALKAHKEYREWVRANPENPVCPGCNRREEQTNLIWEVYGRMVCSECADDQIELETGCRFGMSPCPHEDCKISVTSNVLEWKEQ